MASVVGYVATFDGVDAPEWGRTSYIDPGSGQVYVPAVLGGNEEAVFLCASFDGVSVVAVDDHVYVPAEWMAKEHPDAAPACRRIVGYVRAAHAGEAPPG